MKKIISGSALLTAAMLIAPMSAFADTTITPTGGDPFDVTPNPGTAGTTVEFSVDPAYTLTINNKEKASGDTVATFSTNADLTLVQQSDTMHFTADVPTYAGDYSDTVTFTISVNDSSIKAYILDDSFMPTETTITIPVNTGMAWGESATALSDEEVEVFLNNLLNDVPDTAHPADTLYSVNLSEDETKEERGILYYTGTELYAVFCYGEDIEDMEPVSSEDKLSDTLNYVVFDELDLIRAGGI